MLTRAQLDQPWTVVCTNPQVLTDAPAEAAELTSPIPAEVPGSVHTDLLAAGLIPDPYADDQEQRLTWLFPLDWRYRTTLQAAPAEPGERIDLVFDGIDTLGTIRLDGQLLGRTRNMHRSYRFDVTGVVDGTAQELTVDLASATTYALAEEQRLGVRPRPYPTPFNYLRKMACSFGWDWGPDLRTAGLWQPVRVERWRVARLARVRPLVGVDGDGTGRVEVVVDLQHAGDPANAPALTLTAEVLGRSAAVTVEAGATTASVAVEVPDAPLWWPVGYGDQPLADLTVTLTAGADELDRWQRAIGFRTVSIDTTPDEYGTPFTLCVNGRPVFVRGANWIPDDHFLTRITPERIGRRLDQALGAHLNLVRIWGGGIYETEDFYAACDARGLLVWQDFLLACAAYAEEQPLWDEIAAEARENVVRLMPHPSLILWNGGNENVWGYQDWGWQELLEDRTWGDRYAHELLPGIVAELDPTRPYTANSPFSPAHAVGGDQDGRAGVPVHPNDPDHGTHHQWEVWNRIDYTRYRSEIPRFCSEFGFQGPPAWRTLAEHVHSADGRSVVEGPDPKNDPVFLIHQKAEDGNGKLDRGLAPHLGVPADFADWHWATQLNQARAVRHAVEHYRSWWPRTAGAIVWQLNDCWPVTSWAAVDSEERPKPLWYGLRAAYAPRLLAVVERDGRPAVAVVNDTDAVWSGALALTRETAAGEHLATTSRSVSVAARSVEVVAVPDDVARAGDPAREVLVAELPDAEAPVAQTVHAFAEDIGLDLEPRPFTAVVRAESGGYAVEITATSLARDLFLAADRVAADAQVDEGLITLRAGQTVTLHVSTGATLDPAALTAPAVLRCANDLRAVVQTGELATAGRTVQP